jgi:hypothetical protein
MNGTWEVSQNVSAAAQLNGSNITVQVPAGSAGWALPPIPDWAGPASGALNGLLGINFFNAAILGGIALVLALLAVFAFRKVITRFVYAAIAFGFSAVVIFVLLLLGGRALGWV